MPSDMRSISFVFQRDHNNSSGFCLPKGRQSQSRSRRRLQDRFEKEDKKKESKKSDNGNSTTGWQNISQDSKRALRNGAVRITKTWSNVKLTFDTFSQKFKTSTKRCRRLDEQYTPSHNSNLQTPQTRSRYLLGRTPTKLYSPFGIESPKNSWDTDYELTPVNAVPKLCQNKSQRFFRLLKERSFYGLR